VKFKPGDRICWRSTGQKETVHAVTSDGKIVVNRLSGIGWSDFFFAHVIEPNLIMKDIIRNMKVSFALKRETFQESEPKYPTKAYPDDAGYDLYCTNNITINGGDVAKIPTGVVCAIPEGFYGKIAERSSMALRGSKCLGGIIDSSYRGPVSVIMTNLSKNPLVISAGDKIAQLVIHVLHQEGSENVNLEDLPESTHSRGTKGFGSSGI